MARDKTILSHLVQWHSGCEQSDGPGASGLGYLQSRLSSWRRQEEADGPRPPELPTAPFSPGQGPWVSQPPTHRVSSVWNGLKQLAHHVQQVTQLEIQNIHENFLTADPTKRQRRELLFAPRAWVISRIIAWGLLSGLSSSECWGSQK